MPPEDDVSSGHADVVPTEDLRWSKNKFYTRKPKIPKPEPAPAPEVSGDDIDFSTPLPHPPSVMSSSPPASPPAPPPPPPPPPPESATEMTWTPAEDKNDGAAIVNRTISIDLQSYTKTELRQLRRKLAAELDQVRSLLRRTEEFLEADTAPTAAERENSQHSIYITEPEPTTTESHNLNKSPNLVAAGGGDFEFSPNSHFSNQKKNLVVVGRDVRLSPDSHNLCKVNSNQDPNLVAAGCNFEFSPNNHSFNNLKNASRYSVEHDSLVVVDKEMISQPERNLFLGRKLDCAFKSCGSLLTKLMRHKFGWVFNKPVDVRGLGLYDYYTIIREPMDLGTVKTRLSKKRYDTLSEFARDVRLTFNNAIRYNPKGQDVHFMAEQLLKIFEERWSAIEAASAYCPPPSLPPRPPPPPPPPPVKPNWLVAAHPGSGWNRALYKPKAKDLHKRDMTMDEKGRLRSRLEDLPVEKLDGIVQIIHKRTPNLNQDDDEIEVDFEILDAETLWELDRYVTNYKKSLSKHKRKAELAMLAKQTERKRMQERVLEPVVVEQSMVNNQAVVSNQTPRRENRRGCPSESSSSGNSSSDSGSSSSSGPDTDSSSECGSDAAH